MDRDPIAAVEIDDAGRLHVKPRSQEFPYIYREAMEIVWDPARRSLHSPKPREWSCARWYEQIVAAAREQGWELRPTSETKWVNVDPGTKAEILSVQGQSA
jgi:hypothetical protein